MLVAVCQNVASGKKITYQVFGGAGIGVLLTADNIAANTITTNLLDANAINGMTITGALVRTSAGSTRVQMDSSGNTLSIYYVGDLRMQLSGDSLVFLGPGEVGGGAVYSLGTNQLDIDVGGGDIFEFNESGLFPLVAGMSLGDSADDWDAIYTRFVFVTDGIQADGANGDSDTINVAHGGLPGASWDLTFDLGVLTDIDFIPA
jgi:hypothetical protein